MRVQIDFSTDDGEQHTCFMRSTLTTCIAKWNAPAFRQIMTDAYEKLGLTVSSVRVVEESHIELPGAV